MYLRSIYKKSLIAILLLVAASVSTGLLWTDQAEAKGRVVVIDPGHGSVANSRPIEGPIELSIAFRLKSLLEKDGYTVVMTRTKNGQAINGYTGRGYNALDAEHYNLAERGKIANNANADLLVSIHSDAHERDQFAILYPDAANVKDRLGHVIKRDASYSVNCKNLGNYMYQAFKSSGFSPSSDRPLRGEAYNNSSRPETLGMPLALSAHTEAPMVTVEVYGHKSSRLNAKYSQASTQDKVANTLRSAVNKYFSVTPQAQAKEEGQANPDTQADGNTDQSSNQRPKFLDELPPIAAQGIIAPQTGPLPPKANRSEKCPPESPKAGPTDGADYRTQIAKVFEQLLSLNSAGGDDDTPAGEEGEDIQFDPNVPDGVLKIPAIDESKYGLVGRCNRAAAGMALFYRTGKWDMNKVKSPANTYGILAHVGTGVRDVHRSNGLTQANWDEIRHQVLARKNPVVLATGFGSKNMHYITITGFVGSKVYFNDGAHFVGNGAHGQVANRTIEFSELIKPENLRHSQNGYRYLYAK